MEKHDDVTADRELTTILQVEPNNAEAYLARGILLYRKGQFAEAEGSLRKTLELRPQEHRATLFLALTHASIGQCKEALQALQQGFADFGKGELHRLAGIGLAQCQLNLDKPTEAETTLIKLRADQADDPDTLYQAARIHLALWNSCLLELYKKAPESWQFHKLSGETLEAQDRFSDAAVEYRKALGANPRVPGVHFRLGRCLLLGSHDPSGLEEARTQFAMELAINPRDASAEYELGQIAWTQHQADEALRNFDQALALRPGFVEASIGIAKIYLERKQPEKAIPVLETAVSHAPENQGAHYSLMVAYRDAGRMAEAAREQKEIQKSEQAQQSEWDTLVKQLRSKDQVGEAPQQ